MLSARGVTLRDQQRETLGMPLCRLTFEPVPEKHLMAIIAVAVDYWAKTKKDSCHHLLMLRGVWVVMLRPGGLPDPLNAIAYLRRQSLKDFSRM